MALVAVELESYYRGRTAMYIWKPLEDFGITNVARLKNQTWKPLQRALDQINSGECTLVLDLLHWMASRGIRFSDFDPQAEFPTVVEDCNFKTRIYYALKRSHLHRLEMLRFFTAQQIREGTHSAIAAGGLNTLRAALAQRNCHLKGEGK